MNISEKIAAIRLQPEHIRIRWVWGCVLISMFIIALIWLFSLANLFQPEENSSNPANESGIADLKNQIQSIPQPSAITDFAENEGIYLESSNEFQYPAKEITSPEPESPAYKSQL